MLTSQTRFFRVSPPDFSPLLHQRAQHMAIRQGQKKEQAQGSEQPVYDESYQGIPPQPTHSQPASQTANPTAGLSLHHVVHILYGLFAVGLVASGSLALALLAAVVLAYLKRDEAATTPYASHISWLLATFWWGLLWGVLSYLLLGIYIGWLSGLLTVLWLLYRVARGWLALCEGNSPSTAEG